jgi:hypothetical protein
MLTYQDFHSIYTIYLLLIFIRYEDGKGYLTAEDLQIFMKEEQKVSIV